MARTSTTLARPCLVRERLQLLQRQVDVGALAAERRADEPDDRERACRSGRASSRPSASASRRTSPETSASLPPAGARKRPFVTCAVVTTPIVGCVWSTPPIVYAVVVMFVCGGSSTCFSVCCGVVKFVRNRRSARGQALRERAAVGAAEAAAAAAAAAAEAAAAAVGALRSMPCGRSFCEARLHRLELGRRRPRDVALDPGRLAAGLELRDDLRDDRLPGARRAASGPA